MTPNTDSHDYVEDGGDVTPAWGRGNEDDDGVIR